MKDIKLLYKKSDGPSVIEFVDDYNNIIHAIMSENIFQSATYTDERRFEMYTKYSNLYDVVYLFNKDIKSTLVLGGGGFSYPKYYINKYKDKDMDVVEIDPEMVYIANNYFYLNDVDQKRLNVIIDDAFTYIDNCEKKYDSIFVDLYIDRSVSIEALKDLTIYKMKNLLNDGGILSFNYIHVIDNNEMLYNYFNTLKNNFNYVKSYITDDCFNSDAGNIFFVASDKEITISPNDIAIEFDISKYCKMNITR